MKNALISLKDEYDNAPLIKTLIELVVPYAL